MKYFLKRFLTICLLVVFYLVRPGSGQERDLFALIDHPIVEQEQNSPGQESPFVFVENELNVLDFRSQLNRQVVRIHEIKENLIDSLRHLDYDPDVDSPITCLKLPPSRYTAYS